MDVSDDIKNLVRMCSALAEDSPDGDDLRGLCVDTEGRSQVCMQFSVPYKNPGDIGYVMVHYENDLNFNQCISNLFNSAKQILVGQPADPITEPISDPKWRYSSMLEFLSALMSDPTLKQQFINVFRSGSDNDKDAFLKENLPNHPYKEWEAIRQLMEKNDDEGLELSINKFVSTFQREFQFGC